MNNEDNWVNINLHKMIVKNMQDDINRKCEYLKARDKEVSEYIKRLAKLETDNFAMKLRLETQEEIIEHLKYGSYGAALELLK